MSSKSSSSSSGVDTEARRHPLLAFIMQIGIRINYGIQSWLGFRPLFLGVSSNPSFLRPSNAPKYDSITKIGFAFIWTIAGLPRDSMLQLIYGLMIKTGVVSLLNMFHEWLSNRLIKQFKESGFDASKEVPIPEFDWQHEKPEVMLETFVKARIPVVLRGFMKGKPLLDQLSWENLHKRFGEEDVFLTKPELDGYDGKLKEVNDPQTYLHNSECLFSRYPELRKLFEYEKLEPYCDMKVGYEQLFAGRAGTGTPFHHAAVFNMFYQIDGTKKWWFIEPYDSYLAYPLQIFGKAAGMMGVIWPGEGNQKDFPLFDYCPRYSVVLQPGDVMFIPPWWWHAIKNTSETTVAVASRWHTNGICGHNLMMTEEDYEIDRMSSFGFMMGPSSWNFLHSILQTPSPRFDEHITLREKFNRFVHHQLKWNREGGLKALGVTSKF